MVVQHNLTAMNANRMLGTTTSAQAKATEKLSSGYKINRAADDASGLAISEKMRKQIRGLTQASTNAEDGISSVQTAEGALTEVHDMLQRMNELAVKASNGTNSESDRQSIQDEIDQLVTEIDRVSETTKFNETYLLKGDENAEKKVDFEYSKLAYTAETTLYDSTGTEVAKGTILNSANDYYTDRTAGTNADDKVNVSATGKDIDLLHATAVKFTENVYTRAEDGSVTFILAGNDVAVGTTVYASARDAALDNDPENPTGTGIEIKSANLDVDDATHLNAWKDNTGINSGLQITSGGTTTDIKMYVSEATSDIELYKVDANGEVETFAAGEKIKLADIQAAATTDNLYKAVRYTVAANDKIDPDNFGDYGNAHQLMDSEGNEIAANGLYSYFEKDDDGKWNYKGGLYTVDDDGKRGAEATKAQVDAFVNETTKETGALTLTFHVGADATTNNQISVDLDAMSASSLGIKGIKVTGKDDTNALNAIETIKAAIQQVSEQRSALGAVQNRLEHTISNLDNVVENTTSAESQIRDTDMASAMVEYSKNNILQQAGQSMLAQANQANQGVLSLLG